VRKGRGTEKRVVSAARSAEEDGLVGKPDKKSRSLSAGKYLFIDGLSDRNVAGDSGEEMNKDKEEEEEEEEEEGYYDRRGRERGGDGSEEWRRR
jgi:hypothetical protein